MITVTSTEAKRRFGEILDRARREPVRVQSHGRDVAVILDHEEYDRLRRREDAYWLARAEEGRQSGFLSAEETRAFLEEKLRREDD